MSPKSIGITSNNYEPPAVSAKVEYNAESPAHSQLMWTIILASGMESKDFFSGEFAIERNVGLKSQYTSIHSDNAYSMIECISACSRHPCCLSAIWKPKMISDKCFLYDAVFLPQLLTQQHDGFYLTRNEAHPSRSKYSTWKSMRGSRINNYDLKKEKADTNQDCIDRCDQHTLCISADFLPADMSCYLSQGFFLCECDSGAAPVGLNITSLTRGTLYQCRQPHHRGIFRYASAVCIKVCWLHESGTSHLDKSLWYYSACQFVGISDHLSSVDRCADRFVEKASE
ncbi:hypothetical protein CAPTEDRAFT_198340 [Capitella teleta]|uniref:Apple domain-containing protein n=1 Tax=Capitella teleta TaxID=283909 RepID=R7U9W1_CAPTE|nr:hypothetical protein CAPTEDRAFT_198340 [Capitella teleta]|eukprot:ELU03150.1 hypothetical protein CAPTEDRAFT_198340 [Capitella teleta]